MSFNAKFIINWKLTKRGWLETYILHSGGGWSKWSRGVQPSNFEATFAPLVQLFRLQITNWDIFRIAAKPTSFRILSFHLTQQRWWQQAPRICNNERIGKNDENLWLFVVGIIWTGLACFPASKGSFKYLTTGLKGVNFVLEINSSPPLSQISVNTWAGQWTANRLHWDCLARRFGFGRAEGPALEYRCY